MKPPKRQSDWTPSMKFAATIVVLWAGTMTVLTVVVVFMKVTGRWE